MFDVKGFSNILQKITDTYTSISEFAEKSEVNRTYLSKYINMKLDNPPTPKILEKLANASNDIVSYAELMKICGYYEDNYNLLTAIEKETLSYYEKTFAKLHFTPYQKDRLSKLIHNFKTNNISNYKQEIINFSNEFFGHETEVYNLIISILEMVINKYEQQLEIFSYSLSSLPGSSKQSNAPSQFYMCPVYGCISAGIPNWAEECIEGRLPIDPILFNIINPEEYFFLRVNGESMNKIIRNGAYALIHKQDIVENGEIAVVLVNGDEATLKKFSKQRELIVLEPMSNDNSFQVQIYDKTTSIKILGKYVGKFEMNK